MHVGCIEACDQIWCGVPGEKLIKSDQDNLGECSLADRNRIVVFERFSGVRRLIMRFAGLICALEMARKRFKKEIHFRAGNSGL